VSKNWLITGASSGFGRLLAERVAANGEQVIAVARRRDRLDELATTAPGLITPLVLDLTSAEAGSVIAAAIQAAGGLDVLVNNAGAGLFTAVEQADDQTARAIFETNFFANLTVLRTALPALRSSAGRIVQISSYLGQVGMAASGLYSASKSAVELVSDALAAELVPAGVRVTTIQPGLFGTDFAGTSHVVAPNDVYASTVGAFLNHIASLPPAAFGDPAQVAEAVLSVVVHPNPPRRLAVGTAAAEAIRSTLEAQLAELAEWQPVSTRQGPAA